MQLTRTAAKFPGTPGWLVEVVAFLTWPTVVTAAVAILFVRLVKRTCFPSKSHHHYIVRDVRRMHRACRLIGARLAIRSRSLARARSRSLTTSRRWWPRCASASTVRCMRLWVGVTAAAGLSRPIAKRLEQLHALRRFFVENEDKIVAALQADLGRPLFEALYYDNLLPLAEIDVRACRSSRAHVLRNRRPSATCTTGASPRPLDRIW